MPSYHDLHITTARIPRTSIFNLPYGLEVRCSCTRVTGWELWSYPTDLVAEPKLIAGEYAGPDKWLVLDVAGHVIVDSRHDHGPENGCQTCYQQEPPQFKPDNREVSRQGRGSLKGQLSGEFMDEASGGRPNLMEDNDLRDKIGQAPKGCPKCGTAGCREDKESGW